MNSFEVIKILLMVVVGWVMVYIMLLMSLSSLMNYSTKA